MTDTDYITRSELALLMTTVVSHYEKRIQSLENSFLQVLQALKVNQAIPSSTEKASTPHEDQENQPSVLQPNTNILNKARSKKNSYDANNIPPHQTQMFHTNEALSTENSESTLLQKLHQQTNQKVFLSELQHILVPSNANDSIQQVQTKYTNEASTPQKVLTQSQESITKSQSQQRPSSLFSKKKTQMMNPQTNNTSINQNNYASVNSNYYCKENQNQSLQKGSAGKGLAGMKQQSKIRSLNSSKQSGIKVQKRELNSEIKDKISMFQLQNYFSPTEANQAYFYQQQSTQNNLLHSESIKQFSSSPDSLLEGTTSQSQDIQKKQMISICTQDYHVTEVQSPSIMEKYKSNSEAQNKHYYNNHPSIIERFDTSKNDQSHHHQYKDGGSSSIKFRDVSLSILLEEENSSNINKQFLQGFTGQNSSTFDNRTSLNIKDTRLSLGIQNQYSNMNTLSQQQQRCSSSLSNKNQNNKSALITNKKTIFTKQSNKQLSNGKPKKKIQSIQNPYQQIQSNYPVIQNPNEPKNVSVNKVEKQKKKTNKVSSGNKYSAYSQRQGVLTQNNRFQDTLSIAKILMPQLTSDRLFQIKTPLGLHKSKTPNGANELKLNGVKKQNTIDLSKKENIPEEGGKSISCIFQQDLILRTSLNGINNIAVNSSQREPLTVRDLERIESQHQYSNIIENTNYDHKQSLQQDKQSSNKHHSKHSSLITSSRLNSSNVSIQSMSSQRASLQPQQQQSHSQSKIQKMFSCNAESRLHNLVQTIQKYKHEGESESCKSIKNTSETNTVDMKKDGSLVNLYENFEKWQDQNVTQPNTERQLQFPNIEQEIDDIQMQELINKNILNYTCGMQLDPNTLVDDEIPLKSSDIGQCIEKASNESIRFSKAQSQMRGDHMSFSGQENIPKEFNKNEYNSLVGHHQSLGNLDYQISSQIKMSIFVNNPSESTIKDIEEHNNTGLPQSASSLEETKSRNLVNSHEYFSFSNLEEKDKMYVQSIYEHSTHVMSDQLLERCDTMIKLDYGRYRGSVKSSEQKNRKALSLSDLTGDVLDIIGDYLNINETTPPYFTLCNSKLLRNFSSYKKENYSIQNEILQDQINELKKELYDYFEQNLFKMSKGLNIIYLSNINSKDWIILNELCRDKLLNKDDTTLLRVYFILLGIKPDKGELDLQEQIYRLITDNKNKLNPIFNPELHFTFGPQILQNVGLLLQQFSLENYIINYSRQQHIQAKKIRTLQIMAQIIYEALQFCKIVPNRIESDIRELERVIDHYSKMQNRLERYQMIKMDQ